MKTRCFLLVWLLLAPLAATAAHKKKPARPKKAPIAQAAPAPVVPPPREQTDLAPVRLVSRLCNSPDEAIVSTGVALRTDYGLRIVTAAGSILSERGQNSCNEFVNDEGAHFTMRLVRQDWAAGLALLEADSTPLYKMQVSMYSDPGAKVFAFNGVDYGNWFDITDAHSTRHNIPLAGEMLELGGGEQSLSDRDQGAGVFDSQLNWIGLVSSQVLTPGHSLRLEPRLWMRGQDNSQPLILPAAYVKQWMSSPARITDLWLDPHAFLKGNAVWTQGGLIITERVAQPNVNLELASADFPTDVGGIGGISVFTHSEVHVEKSAAATSTPGQEPQDSYGQKLKNYLESLARGAPAQLTARDPGTGQWRIQDRQSPEEAMKLIARPDVIVLVRYASSVHSPARLQLAKQLELNINHLQKEFVDMLLDDQVDGLVTQIQLGSRILQSPQAALWTAQDFALLRNADSPLAAQWPSMESGDPELTRQIRAQLDQLAALQP